MIFCKWTVHLWYDHHCTSFCWIFFGLWQTLIFCDTDALFEKQQKKKQNISGFMAESCTGFHCCISTCLPFLSLFIFWKSQSRLQLLLFLSKYWFCLIPDWYLSLSSPSTLPNWADVCNLSAYFICSLISPLSKMKKKAWDWWTSCLFPVYMSVIYLMNFLSSNFMKDWLMYQKYYLIFFSP